ncbi:peptidase S24-like protein [Plasticicumulans acidivorans]|uniref:Peptidase S24-like protein n=2 Tax=Plasticicumulans acidivorans TaxID=886464 RepID=A0A317MS58_9GAMM|nr:peptidase S24-like protein [Plasticicumulans acidivorans]
MTPRFRDGELIFVDPQRDARHGDFVVVRLAGGEVLLRELLIEAGLRMLRATHPDWPAPLRTLDASDTLVGVVIARLERF